jgi:hypothetical protein
MSKMLSALTSKAGRAKGIGMSTAAFPALQPYRARRVEFLRRADVDDWALKLYAIAAPECAVGPELVEHALRVGAAALPAPATTPQRYGAGFVVVHAAPARSYVLVCWWSDENEIHQRMFSAPAGRPESLAPHGGAAIGCVWELAVTDFERRAWLAHVLTRPGGPDLAGYLAEELTGVV